MLELLESELSLHPDESTIFILPPRYCEHRTYEVGWSTRQRRASVSKV